MIKELLQYRELLYYFTWREFKVRYKQTALGVFWVIFQPLFFAAIINFTLLRGRVFDFGAENIPSILPVYIGLLYWNYFEQSLNGSSNSLVNNQSVITKVYFPRFIPSVASTISALIDFFIASILLVAISYITEFKISYTQLPLALSLVTLIFFFVNGAGILLGTLNVRFRDIRIALPFLIRILLFSTPVFYPLSFIPSQYHWILFLNPVTYAIEASRSLILNTSSMMPDVKYLFLSLSSILFFLISGFAYFRKKERVFIDII